MILRSRSLAHSSQSPVKLGDIVIVRYYDSILFRDVLETPNLAPVVRETIGWLDFKDTEYIRVVWERHAEAIIGEESKTRITGLAIRKNDIIGMTRIA